MRDDLLTAGDVIDTIIDWDLLRDDQDNHSQWLVLEVAPQDFEKHSTGVSEVLLLEVGTCRLLETAFPVLPMKRGSWQRLISWREMIDESVE